MHRFLKSDVGWTESLALDCRASASDVTGHSTDGCTDGRCTAETGQSRDECMSPVRSPGRRPA